MRSHSCIACSALVVFLLACGASVADRIDLDTARAIAAQHADSPLSDREPAIRERPGAPATATFTTEEGQPGGSYTVSLDQGCLVSWQPNAEMVYDPTADPITDEEAVERAKTVAERHLGDAARDLSWEVVSATPDTVKVRGQALASGDPPRTGLGPWCEVHLLRAGGVVHNYLQQLPESTDALEARVSREQAIEAARKGLDHPDLPLLDEPSLNQFRGTVRWHVRFGSSRDERVLVIVDAQSGEVVEVSPTDTAVEPTAAPPAQGSAAPVAADESDSTSAPWALYGGIVLLCAIALGLFLLRRRLT